MFKYILLIALIQIGCSSESKKIESKIADIEFDENMKGDDEDGIVNFDELLKQFNKKETSGRQHILYELNEKNYPKIKSLLEKALDDESEMVKTIAIQSIKDRLQIESLEKLIKVFENSNNNTIVSNLCRTFAEFQKREPIPSIVEKLESKNEMIIYDCIWTLGEIGNKTEIEILERFTSNSNVPKLYDDEGFLKQTTQFNIGEIAKK